MGLQRHPDKPIMKKEFIEKGLAQFQTLTIDERQIMMNFKALSKRPKP